jgi:hypothetical protein
METSDDLAQVLVSGNRDFTDGYDGSMISIVTDHPCQFSVQMALSLY